MAYIKINKLSDEEIKAQNEKKSARAVWILLLVICGVLGIISLCFFLWEQPLFEFDECIDETIFGTFGDFVGGILGTIVAVFSVYFLVRTLRSQIDSNTETVKSNTSVTKTNNRLIELNNLQLFDNQFQTLYRQYLNAIDSYKENDLIGRKALEQKIESFFDSVFVNAFEYKRRSKAAVSLFEDFYAENRNECAVHFRVLYLLVSLIAEAEIDEKNRVIYAKCIRGQLSEGELAIIRYNCMTGNGNKMQRYANHFNLLKHLPLMTLFEFRRWKNVIKKEDCLSAIDSLFISLKKLITNLNENPQKNTDIYGVSTRYEIELSFDEKHESFEFRVIKKKKHIVGGGSKRPLVEKALDYLDETQLTELFEAFLYDSLIASSFGLFNSDGDCKVGPAKVIENDKETFVVSIPVMKNKRIVLAERQLTPGL